MVEIKLQGIHKLSFQFCSVVSLLGKQETQIQPMLQTLLIDKSRKAYQVGKGKRDLPKQL